MAVRNIWRKSTNGAAFFGYFCNLKPKRSVNWFDLHTHGPVKAALGIRNCFAHEPVPAEWHSVGLHPMHITKDWPQMVEVVAARASDQNCLAVGECGLDHRLEVPMDLQRRVFEAQLEVADHVNK